MLQGTENILRKKLKGIFICVYHNSDDGVKIKEVLNNFKYKTKFSEKYMVIALDDKLEKTVL